MAKSILDQFIEGFGNAVQDIREKAVEQAYFGQTVTDNILPTPDVETAEPATKRGIDAWPDYLKVEPKGPDDIAPREPGFDR